MWQRRCAPVCAPSLSSGSVLLEYSASVGVQWRQRFVLGIEALCALSRWEATWRDEPGGGWQS